MLPDKASMWVAAAGRGAAGLDFWDDVYGFSMAPIAEAIRADSRHRAVVAVVPSDEVEPPGRSNCLLRPLADMQRRVLSMSTSCSMRATAHVSRFV